MTVLYPALALTRGLKCHHPRCLRPATRIAAQGEGDRAGFYCDDHAQELTAGAAAVCPNCQCNFRVEGA